METLNQELYFDPFAEEAEQLFDPKAAFARLEERYIAGDVEHDYTADNFVRDTEALMLDAMFVERFDAVRAVALRMHELCGDDHMLSQSLQSNDSLSSLFGAHKAHDGHDHAGEKHNHKNDDEYEVDVKTGKKTKKKKRRGWFGIDR